jgi:hypothetical protein
MTVADLVIGTDLDPSGIEAGMAEIQSMMRGNAQNIARSLGVVESSAGEAAGALEHLTHGQLHGVIELTKGLGELAREGNLTSSVLREMTTGVIRVVGAFGEWALIVIVVGLVAKTIYEFLHRTTEEMEKAEKAWRETINKMKDDFDQLGLLKQLREIEIGKPSAGVGAGGGYIGSLRDLKVRLQQAQDDIATADATWNRKLLVEATRRKNDLIAQITPLQKRYDELRDDLLNPIVLPGMERPIEGLAKTMITVNSAAKDAEEHEKKASEAARQWAEAISNLASQGSALSSLFNEIQKRHEATYQVAYLLQTTYDQLYRKLVGLTDPLGTQLKQWTEIRKALDDIGNTEYFKWLKAGALVVPKLTPTFAPTVPRVPEAARTETLLGTAKFIDELQAGFADLFKNLKDQIAAAYKPTGGVLTILGDVGSQLGATLVQAFGPVALLLKAMEPALNILNTLFDALIAPIAAVVEVMVQGLLPWFKLLYPVVKDVAIVMTVFGEVTARIVSAIARFVGNVIYAIGALIAHIPFLGNFGHAIENAGKSVLNFADGLKQSADEMAATRKNLETMQFGTTADALAGLGDSANAAADALSSIPYGVKQLVDYLHYVVQSPVGAAGYSSASGVMVNGDVLIDARALPASALFEAVKTEAQTRARSQTGRTSDASQTFNL